MCARIIAASALALAETPAVHLPGPRPRHRAGRACRRRRAVDTMASETRRFRRLTCLERFLALGTPALVVGPALAADPQLADRGDVDHVVDAPVPGPGQPVPVVFSGGGVKGCGAVHDANRFRSANRASPGRGQTRAAQSMVGACQDEFTRVSVQTLESFRDCGLTHSCRLNRRSRTALRGRVGRAPYQRAVLLLVLRDIASSTRVAPVGSYCAGIRERLEQTPTAFGPRESLPGCRTPEFGRVTGADVAFVQVETADADVADLRS